MIKYGVLLVLLVSVSVLRAQDDPKRQFDFWIGVWDVTDSGKVIAASTEELTVDSCMLIENYFESDGYTGKSINFFDPYLKKWRQTWVDCQGNVSEFVGEFRDGAMRFEGESHRAGKKIFRRLTFFNLGPDRVRQYSEASLDGIKWHVNYDYLYIRKK